MAGLSALSLYSCTKGYLDIKPDKALVVPSTLEDFQQLLDNSMVMNVMPGLGEVSSDDYFSTDPGLLQVTPTERNAYLWAADIYQGDPGYDWNTSYQQVFYANTILKALGGVLRDSSNLAAYDQVLGSAYFYRGEAFFNLAQIFCLPYDSAAAVLDPGIPLRLDPDINLKQGRGTLQQTYDQAISDLDQASRFLPASIQYQTRPSKPAAFGLLSRVYLSMGAYTLAGAYADSSLQLYDQLVNYNTLNPTAVRPLHFNNPEIIFDAWLVEYRIYSNDPTSFVDTALYDSYDSSDLRKPVFFSLKNGYPFFKGVYTGSLLQFGGVATDELYLNRAECYAREDQTSLALNDLNTLLQNRYVTGTFTPLRTIDPRQALQWVLEERRKELPFRGLRWMDLRRLNRDPSFALTLKRQVGGQIYTLAPNDPRYVMPIPDDEIRGSGLKQNPR